MLKTGNRKRAFTLIEIMVTTAVFSLATLFIYESLFRSLDLVNYCDDYLRVISWVDDRMWQAQNEIERFNLLSDASTGDTIVLNGKEFRWNIAYRPAGNTPRLYRIDSRLSWREGRKGAAISRTAYAIYEEENK